MKEINNKYLKGSFKRKIKITLATLTAFLITGHMSYAGEVIGGGKNCTVSGDGSIVWGEKNFSNGTRSTAFGFGTLSSDYDSLAFGQLTQATGGQSTAFGVYSKAKGNLSTAWGWDTLATGERSTSFGFKTHANGDNSLSFGSSTYAGGKNALSFGTGVKKIDGMADPNFGALGENSLSFGNETKASGKNSVAGGNNSIAEAENSFAFGDGVRITENSENSIAIGKGSTVYKSSNAMALLGGDVSNSDGSLAIGRGSKAITLNWSNTTGKYFNSENEDLGNYKIADFDTKVWDDDGYKVGTIAIGNQDDKIFRRITGLANGRELSDAVNVAQLTVVDNKITGITNDIDNKINTGVEQKIKNFENRNRDRLKWFYADTNNVLDGGLSLRAGFNAKAQGYKSIAIGYDAEVKENGYRNSIAIGAESQANGNSVIAIGAESKGLGTFAQAFGAQSYASGEYSQAFGVKAAALYKNSIAFGAWTQSREENAIAFGNGALGNMQRGIAIGNNATVGNKDLTIMSTGSDGIAIGGRAEILGTMGVGIGAGAEVKGNFGTSIGASASAAGDSGVAIGPFANASKMTTVSIGRESIASGIQSTSIGAAAKSYGYDSLSMGASSETHGSHTVAIGTLAKAGHELNSAEKQKLDEIIKKINAENNGKSKEEKEALIAVETAKAEGGYSQAFGFMAQASKLNSIAIGREAKALSNEAVAFGTNAKALGDRSIAFGKNAFAGHKDGEEEYIENNASGIYTKDSNGNYIKHSSHADVKGQKTYSRRGDLGFAFGYGANAHNFGSIAVGYKTENDGYKSMAFGNKARIEDGGSFSTAMGYKSNISSKNSISIGVSTRVTGDSSIAIGNQAYAGRGFTEKDDGKYINIKIQRKVAGETEEIARFIKLDNYETELENLLAENPEETYSIEVKGNDEVNWVKFDKNFKENNVKFVKYEQSKLGDIAIAMGNNAYATNNFTTAIGNNSWADGAKSIAMGDNTIALGDKTTIIGNDAIGTKFGGVALGYKAIAHGIKSMAIGTKTFAGFRSIAHIRDDDGDFIEFQGEYYKYDKNAKSITIDGKEISYSEIEKLAPDSTKFRYKAVALNNTLKDKNGNFINFTKDKNGNYALVDERMVRLNEEGKYRTLDGKLKEYQGDDRYRSNGKEGGYSLAIGYHTTAPTSESIAIGYNAHTLGEKSVAVGIKAISEGLDSMAFGNEAKSSGEGSLAIGKNSHSSGHHSIAIGMESISSTDHALAIGHKTNVTAATSIALGNKSIADRKAGEKGYNPNELALTKYTKENNDPFTSSAGALSIGNKTETRQIINVSAGSEDTDAVNVAQLKAMKDYSDNEDKKLKIFYTANSTTPKKDVLLTDGFNFIDGENDNIKAHVEKNGRIRFDLSNNLSKIDKISFGPTNSASIVVDGSGKGKITFNGQGEIIGIKTPTNESSDTAVVNKAYVDQKFGNLSEEDKKIIEKAKGLKTHIEAGNGIKFSEDGNGSVEKPYKINVDIDNDTIKINKNGQLSAAKVDTVQLKYNKEDNKFELKDTNKKDAFVEAQNLKEMLNTPINFKTNDDKIISKKLGSQIDIIGKEDNVYNDNYSADNLVTHNLGGKIQIAMKKTPEFHGLDAGNGKITNVTAATNDKDAVNYGQVKNILKMDIVPLIVYTNKDGKRVKKIDGNYYVVNDKINQILNTNEKPKIIKKDDKFYISNGKDSIEIEKISENNVVGSLVDPSNIGNNDINSTLRINNVHSALQDIETNPNIDTIRNLNPGDYTRRAAATIGDLQIVANTPMSFIGNIDTQNPVQKHLGEELIIKGEETKIIDYYKTAPNNIAVVVAQKGNEKFLQIGLSENLKDLNSVHAKSVVTVGDGEKSIKINNNGTITGLKDATKNDEAVNYGQFKKEINEINTAQNKIGTIETGNGIKIISDNKNLKDGNVKISLDMAEKLSDNKVITGKMVYDKINVKEGNYKVIHAGDNVAQNLIDIDKALGEATQNAIQNTVDVKKNTEDITTNSQNINQNKTDIANNTNKVNNLETKVTNQKIDYKQNGKFGDFGKYVLLSDGFDFTDGTNTKAKIEANGVVKFNLDEELTGIKSIGNTENGAKLTLGEKDKNISVNGGKITNVAAGTQTEDAVNFGQLKEYMDEQELENNNQTQAIQNNANAIGDIHEELHEVGSLSAAMAQLHVMQYDPKRPSQVMAGIGNYKNKKAVAVGLSHYINENLMVSASASVSQAKRVNSMLGVGLTYKFGNDNPRERREYPNGYNVRQAAELYEMQNVMYATKLENQKQQEEILALKEKEIYKAKLQAEKDKKQSQEIRELRQKNKAQEAETQKLKERLERLEKLLESKIK